MNMRTNHKDFVPDPEEVEKIVKRFSRDIHKELGELVKSVVWFGSQVKHSFRHGKRSLREETLFGSDIDVLIVFDDMINVVTPEVITAYRVITEKTASNISKRIHITTMPLTKFWDYSSKGDPILINMLRDGTAIYDTGCFGMAQKMLGDKAIRPRKEIVWIYLARGPMSIANSHWNMKEATLDLYWAVLDAAHAALLKFNIVPDTPEHIVRLMDHHLVQKGIMHKRNLSVVAEFMNLGKMLMSGEVQKVSGDHYDRYKSQTEQFIHIVKDIISGR